VPEISGGVIASIDWRTPRLAYANEPLMFDVAGTPGTPITLMLFDEKTKVLEEITDSIRENGHYYWTTSVSNSTDSFVKVRETKTSGIYSLWGHVAPAKSGVKDNTVYAYDTKDKDQWYYGMDKYMVNSGGIMTYHWVTNIDINFLIDYGVKLLKRGDVEVYSETLDNLLDSYYMCLGDHNWMLNKRYIFSHLILSPDRMTMMGW
jgi:hypothetical protein